MLTIDNFSQIYRKILTKKGVTSSLVRLELKRIKPQTLRVLTHVTVENQTSNFTKCRLGIKTGSRDCYLDEIVIVEANELCVSRSDILLGEGDVFFAELTGTTTDDNLVMNCIGWELDL